MRRSSILRSTGFVLVTVGAVAALGTLVVRDQFSRHRRNLFSANTLERFAALGYISCSPPSVELVRMLRDFCAREQNSILRRRAGQLIDRMERQLERQAADAASMPAGFAG